MADAQRDRSGSTTSVKRRREASKSSDSDSSASDMDVEEDIPATVDQLRQQLEDYLFRESSKVSKSSASFILRIWHQMEKICHGKIVEKAEVVAENKLMKTLLKQRDADRTTPKLTPAAASYAGVTKMPPRVGKKIVAPRDTQKVVLVYPKDETITDSEVTKKMFKEVLAPKEQGLQIRAVRKVQKGGLAVESGTKKTAQKIKDITTGHDRLKAMAPKKILPKAMIYDVDKTLPDEEIKDLIYQQNLAEHGVKKEEMAGLKILYRVGRRDAETVNLVVELVPKIREILLAAERVYIDYDSCRIVDFYHISRCYRCQGYGHVQKHCKKAGDCVCSHCGRAGHEFMDCPRKGEKPSCVNCLAAKKPSEHKVGTLECPMYKLSLIHI